MAQLAEALRGYEQALISFYLFVWWDFWLLHQEWHVWNRSWHGREEAGIFCRNSMMSVRHCHSHKDRTGLLEVSCPNPCTEQGQLRFKYLQRLDLTTSLETCPGVWPPSWQKFVFKTLNSDFLWLLLYYPPEENCLLHLYTFLLHPSWDISCWGWPNPVSSPRASAPAPASHSSSPQLHQWRASCGAHEPTEKGGDLVLHGWVQ